MRIALSLNRTVVENAASYFEQAKKMRRKVEGAKKALVISLQKKESLIHAEEKRKDVKKPLARTREWYEKFRWFITGDGFLVIGGRDATTNEIVVKKYADAKDLILHTEMAGSPFMVIKSDGKEIPHSSVEEAAAFTAAVSRAWNLRRGGAEVFVARPEQVTKTPKSGEFLVKGAFVIEGKTERIVADMAFAVGAYQGTVIGGPVSAVKRLCKDVVEIEQGDERPSDVAKKIRQKIGGEIDDIIRVLPSGGMQLKKDRRR